MVKKKTSKKAPEIPEVPQLPKYDGPTRSFRSRNPMGHPDKYNWVTLRKGEGIPVEIQPILNKEAEIEKTKKRIKELEIDLLDDGKKNYSQNPEKKSPGRKKK